MTAAVPAQWPVRSKLFQVALAISFYTVAVTLSRITAFVAATLAAAAVQCGWHDGWLAPIYEVDRGSSYTVSATGSIPEPKRSAPGPPRRPATGAHPARTTPPASQRRTRQRTHPLSVHLTTATGRDGRANQPPVLGQHPRIPLPQRLDQTRRTLNVAEPEGDHPAQQPAHPAPPAPAASRPRQQPAVTPGTAAGRAPGAPSRVPAARAAQPTPAGPAQAPGPAIDPPRTLAPAQPKPVAPRASGPTSRPAASAHQRPADPYPSRRPAR